MEKILGRIKGKEGVSEIIGTVLLLAIAVIIFSSLIVYVFSMDTSPSAPSVHMVGSMESTTTAIIENRGGDSIPMEDLKLVIWKGDHTINAPYTFEDQNNNGIWDVGDYIRIQCNNCSGWKISAVVIDKPSNSIIMSGTLINGVSDYLYTNNTQIASAADFSWKPEPATINGAVSFTDNSANSTFIESWEWDFGDGNTSAMQHPSHTYASSGSYNVTLTVTYDPDVIADGVQNWATVEDTVNVYKPPVANFSWTPTVPQIDENAQFNGKSSNGTILESEDTIDSYEWDFNNDGTYEHSHSSGMYDHNWTSAGTYPVALRISCEIDGGYVFTDTITKNVRVNGPPVAAYDYVPAQP
ncbi:MAG: PKD domain-containing protein, partial [Thermoplasmatota archaeon]